MKKSFLILIVVYFPANLFCQDTTIIFDNKVDFIKSIGHLYSEYTISLTPEVKVKVDSIFKNYDFTASKFDCQYQFTFNLDLDSCGNIQNCESRYSHKDTIIYLNVFMNDICSMLLNSQIQVKNRVVLIDTSFVILYAMFQFESSCDPTEVLFYNEMFPPRYPNPYFIYRNEEEDILFDGFRNGCIEVK